MKKLVIILLASFFSIHAIAQSDNPKYDKALADSLGGDDHGVRAYVFVILKTGSNKIGRKETSDSLFKGHIDNLIRLANAGKLVVSGPMRKNDKAYRGIFILDVKTIEEANALLATDPAITAKLLEVELYQWFGSAALPVYLKTHEKIEKKLM